MIIDMRTGKVLVTDKQLIKDAKKWVASFTFDEFSKMLEEEKRIFESERMQVVKARRL